MGLEESVRKLKGVGEKTAVCYEKLKIKTIYDLLMYFPKKYIDCTKEKTLKEVENGEKAVFRLKILKKYSINKIKNKIICKITAADKLNNIIDIVYFNNMYIYSCLEECKIYIFYGKLEKDYFSTKIINPVLLKSLEIIPKYSLKKGISNNVLIKHIKQAFSFVLDDENLLPKNLYKKYNLIGFKKAVEIMHKPKSFFEYKKARNSLVFFELLCWQVGLLKLKKEKKKENSIKIDPSNLKQVLDLLPFKLTNAQKRVVDEIILDCSKGFAINRLIQGDVGSGKTIVCVLISYLFFKEKQQVALMAPTDILARQHYKTFKNYLENLGVKVSLLVGSLSQKEKSLLLKKIQNGEVDVVIGTHSLFYDKVVFKNLSLIITDEQHRFGVNQREKFLSKGKNAHFLVMSATPIPRTLALVLYGDLDISIIDERPACRIPIKTFFVNSKERNRIYNFVTKQIKKGNQIYFVCPAVEENNSSLNSVYSYYDVLVKNGFNSEKIGVLHGGMNSVEKNQVMEKFLEKDIDILVATTVIEVGVDVESANVIIIENAEMFGLSQLHQLRGRVGRGDRKAYCILVSDNLNKDNLKRMEVMCKTSDGFLISKYDLSLRGAGDLFGVFQHGKENFKISNLKRDLNCARICRKEANEILEKDINLEEEENRYIKKNFEIYFKRESVVL